MAKKRNIAATKVKKKKWYPILASKSFNEKILGESFITEPEKLKNKFMKVNLSTITNNFRDQNINLTFKVQSVIDNKGHTALVNYTILPSFIKRFVRRDKSKIADSFIVKDKTGQRVRVKPLIITHNNATKSQKTEIRKITKNFLKAQIEKTDLESFVSELIKKFVQKKLRVPLKKIMPIKYAEVKTIGYDSVKLLLSKKEVLNKSNDLLEPKEPVREEIVKEIKKIEESKPETKKEEVKEVPKVEETKAPEVIPEEKTETKKEEAKPENSEEPEKKEVVTENSEDKVSVEEKKE